MRKIRVLRIVVVILSFLAGCRSEDSVVDDGADVQTKPNSVAAARYFPTDDGKGDETYEVVLRNSGAAPIELDVLDRRIPFISFDRAAYADAIEGIFLCAKMVGEEFCIDISAKCDCVEIKLVDSNRNLNLDMGDGPETDNSLQALVSSAFYNQTVREILEAITSQTQFKSVIVERRGISIKLVVY